MNLIAIDASRYRFDTPTGVEVYSNHIIDALIDHAVEKKQPIVLLTQRNLNYPQYEKHQEGDVFVAQKIIVGKRLWTLGHLSALFWNWKKKRSTLFVPSHILPLILPTKSIVTIHDVAYRYFPESYTWKQRWLLEWSTRFAVKRATTIIAVSEATKRDLVRFYQCSEKKIKVIYHGFEKEKFCTSFHDKGKEGMNTFGLEEGKYLCFIGRIEEKKNVPLLVEAFLKAKLPAKWKLVLIGKDGMGSERVDELIKQNAEENIIKTGFQNNDMTYSLLQHSGGLIFPSKFEGFGLPVLEAYALGVPVLCSRAGALPEVAGDAAHYIPTKEDSCGNPIVLNDLIESIIKHVQQMENGAYDSSFGFLQVEKFSWKRAGQKTWDVITAV